ncbi:hypothetical protein [Amycolatopsis sp. Hca4]|uniref:hypothetical protein n=1 Tax=Amycolatopsis sp. Hca4 TaxID=2742131 RepID=UPI0015904BD3|nr:hypothetical protein [Amycolatopsis sp. Hca4]QKV74548.1 hypothetical protein HUT10_12780 [Amycolatopsis sp. Hca4]
MSISVRTAAKTYTYETGKMFRVGQTGILSVYDSPARDAHAIAAFADGRWLYVENTESSKAKTEHEAA